jgi:hypothetical protein
MKKNLVLILLFVCVNLISQVTLDPCYHTYEEILAEIDSLQNVYPDLIQVVQIGTTLGAVPYQDPIPIYAVKISENVTIEEDEPKVMYAGQCHAEEVLGVEVTMYMINDLLEHHQQTPWRIWLENLEIWFVPTYNPEGLKVVMNGWDDSWRKNQRDNNLNDTLDIVPGPGGDIDGVDLNRNYSFNWIHGDTLYCPSGEEIYDYYRGPGPVSEGGTQAIRDLAAEHHFIFSINWHSSRSGNYSEKVYYSFEWDGEKRSPDFAMSQSIGEAVAGLIENEPPQTGHYVPSPSTSRTGNAHDWFYQAHGTFQLLIECGTLNLQPPQPIVEDTCIRCSQGAYWLLGRALGYLTEDKSMLTGHITDADTGEPLVAEIIVEEKHASFFAPRLSDELYGRFWRPLPGGTYNLRFLKKGYQETVINNLIVHNSGWTDLDNPPYNGVQLIPLDPIDVIGCITCNGNPVAAEIIVFDIENDTIYTSDGNYSFDSYAGELNLQVTSEDCIPYFYTADLESGSHVINFELLPAVDIFHEDWENGLINWNISGNWAISSDNGNQYIDDSPDVFYDNNSTYSITTLDRINLNGVSDDVVLCFNHRFYVEHDADFCKIEVSTNGTSWDELTCFTGIDSSWHTSYAPLSDYANTRIYLRFTIITDETINDPGWRIDDINIIASVGADTNDVVVPPVITKLYKNYPNPFNPSDAGRSSGTEINFTINRKNHVKLEIYNIKGQLVRSLVNEELDADKYSVTWDGRDSERNPVASGVFFYKMQAGDYTCMKKMLLMK